MLAGSAVPIPAGVDLDYGRYGPDRFLHLVGHAGFTAALVAALDGERPLANATLAVGVSTGYGVCTEILQEAVPGRGFERGDVVAGFVGSVLGAALGDRVAGPGAADRQVSGRR